MGLSDDIEDVDTNPDIETRIDEEYGTGVAHIEPGARVYSALYLDGHNPRDDETKIKVSGYWKDDEPPTVGLSVSRGFGNLDMNMSPERARTLAAELMLAANRADEGTDDLGGESGAGR